jgi:hypothetical protein
VSTEKGQAFVETLLVAPLFFILVGGAVVFSQVARARLAANAWQTRVEQSIAHFESEERQRAHWHPAPKNIEEFLENKPPDGKCADANKNTFCFQSLFDRSKSLGSGFLETSLGSSLVKAPFRRPISNASVFLPGALTPYKRRAYALSSAIATSGPARLRPGHPAQNSALNGPRWNSSREGFNLSTWMSLKEKGKPNGLSALLLKTARASRKAQAAACLAESAAKNYGIGALVELMSSAVLKGAGKGIGCPSATKAFDALSLAARTALSLKATQTLAAEACAHSPLSFLGGTQGEAMPQCQVSVPLPALDEARLHWQNTHLVLPFGAKKP